MAPTFIRLRPVFLFFAIGLGLLSLSRLALVLWQHEAVSAANGWGEVFIQGLRVDFATLCMLLVLPALFLTQLPKAALARQGVQIALSAWLALVIYVLFFLELSTPDFIEEYGLRPNRLFIEYLIYPKEVFSTLFISRPVESTAILVISALAAWAFYRIARKAVRSASITKLSLPSLALTSLAIVLVCVAGIRSTTGHRPMNPAMIAFSDNPTVNVLPLNSFYSLVHAARNLLKEDQGAGEIYGKLTETDVIAAIRQSTGLKPDVFTSADIPSLSSRTATWQGKPKNIVIILEESLGAQFIGSLGGLPLSPNIDRLSEQGWAFTQLYATGTRSVRGIEAVLAGFSPTPDQAVVKRPKSQQNFFTLAALLARFDYDRTFYYGGEAHFDNMKGFFLSNGFNRVIEQKDYENPAFVGSWGASDEDVLLNADQEFKRLHSEGKPFFGFIFSSSNHDPFEFPDGRIELYEQPKNTRNNAAKYADYAVGEFFKKAMAAPYWQDTVFLVIADHDSRVQGANLVPIQHFHIPAVILGADIAPRKDERLASQIDMGPTLLSLAGIQSPNPMIGRDLSNPQIKEPGRAMMQYDKNYAYMQGDNVLIFQPDKPVSQYKYDYQAKSLSAEKIDETLVPMAHAQALWGSMAYRLGWYRLPALAN